MTRTLLASVTFAIGISAHAALPGDTAQGKRLHDANCMGCHDTSVYTRKDRRIQSADDLHKQLNDCGHAANIKLLVEEQRSVVKYLNEQFYKFK